MPENNKEVFVANDDSGKNVPHMIAEDKGIPPQKDNVDNSYRSAFILLDLAKIEYNCEDERTKNIDNRVGILITSLVVLLTFYLPTIQIQPIFVSSVGSFAQGLPLYILFSLHIGTFILALFSLVYLCTAISVREYFRLSATDLSSDRICKEAPNLVTYSFAHKISELILKNAEANDKKVKLYMLGLKYLIAMVISMAISAVIKGIIG